MSELKYCECKEKYPVTSGYEDDFGYWLTCSHCGLRLKDNYYYYNHYDGEDHEDYVDYFEDEV